MAVARRLKLGVVSAIAVGALLIPGTAVAGGPFPSGVLIGTPQDDTLTGARGLDRIFGLGGADQLAGRGGPDSIFGGLGDDWIYGGSGPDLLMGGPGADHIAAGPGNDLVWTAGDETADWVRCGDGRDVAVVDAMDHVANSCEFVWSRDPESSTDADPPSFGPGVVIIGTQDADTLVGTQQSDLIFALGGDDQVYGRAGSDTIFSGTGDDVVYGGPGPDTLFGRPGADHLYGGPGNDLIITTGDDAADMVRCGDGRQDLAIVDPTDEVANDCEFVWQRNPDN